MATKRKRSDPQATRYRIALTALTKAERRKKAAEAAIRALRAKVRRYERALPPERRAEIHAGTKQRKATEAMRKERWKEAETTLKVAARVAGMPLDLHTLFRRRRGGKVGARYGLAIRLKGSMVIVSPHDPCMVWDFRDGFKFGAWGDRHHRKLLTAIADPLTWRAAA